MTTVSSIREIETAAYRCWPASETEEYDGWQLRYADGFSRRGNSVYPVSDSRVDWEVKLDRCRDWYARRGLDLVIRQTPATEQGLDEALDQIGFTVEGHTHVMVVDLEPRCAGTANVDDQPSAIWWTAMALLWGIEENQIDAWRGIVSRISLPVGFGMAPGEGAPVAAGLAVVDGKWIGLFEIIVDIDSRMRGVGSDLTQSLMGWGLREGASRAFLQVVADNDPAISMYEYLGFRRAYSYWYRRAPKSFYQ